MKLSLYNNAPSRQATIPFILAVSLVDEVIPPHNDFHVPVHLSQGVPGAAPVYDVEICGFRLEAEDPDDLLAPSSRLLGGLINLARLPTYVFAASESLLVYPVYTVDDEVFATTPGGPVFRHVELAKVRRFLSDYLHTMKELGTVGQVETLHVRGIDSNTLGLIRPRFYLKKRVPGEDEFWAPVFLAEDGRSIYTYAASARREVPVQGGREVLALHRLVAEALIEDGRLSDPYDLRPDRLFPAGMQHFLAHLERQPYDIAIGGGASSFPLYRNGKAYVAVEHRSDEDRYSLFAGRDPGDLRERVSQDLLRRQVVAADAQVVLAAAQA